MNQNFMKEKPVMPLVISMALPMTFSMLVHKEVAISQVFHDNVTYDNLFY